MHFVLNLTSFKSLQSIGKKTNTRHYIEMIIEKSQAQYKHKTCSLDHLHVIYIGIYIYIGTQHVFIGSSTTVVPKLFEQGAV